MLYGLHWKDPGRSIQILCGSLHVLRPWSITKKTLDGCLKMRATSRAGSAEKTEIAVGDSGRKNTVNCQEMA